MASARNEILQACTREAQLSNKKESLNSDMKWKRYAASNMGSGRVHKSANNSKYSRKSFNSPTSRHKTEYQKTSAWNEILQACTRNLNFQTEMESLNFDKKLKRYVVSNMDLGHICYSSNSLSTAVNLFEVQLADIKRNVEWHPIKLKIYRHILGNIIFPTKGGTSNSDKKIKRYNRPK